MYIFAYIDAGTGSVIIQVVVGVVLGLGVFIKAYWVKIRSLLGGKKKSSKDLRGEDSKTNDSSKK